MKEYRGRDGTHRIWFEPSDIEDTMENELDKAGLYPTAVQPTVNIERLVEGHLHAQLDPYAELNQDVLGITSFIPGENPKVEINKDLTGAVFDEGDENTSLLGRWRATLAHEAAHIILHRSFYELSKMQTSLFNPPTQMDSSKEVIKCFKKNVGFTRGGGDWREFQANKGMAALLMPQRLLKQVAYATLKSLSEGRIEKGSTEAKQLTTFVCELFQVSRQAATIRLEDLGMFIKDGQIQMKPV